ncbi:MAG TPA: DUF262 domain-containing protein [Pyrinomonadaceae bacterium]
MDRVDYQPLVIQDLLNLHKAGELDLNPWYQRRSVWLPTQKAYLINTLFEKKPVPSLYIRHYLDIVTEKSIKEVVDGQQRIRSVLEYVAGDFGARHPNHKKPIKHDDLSQTERAGFKMTSLSVGYLIGADDADVIEIFGRLNSVAKTLNPQEKRNARFSGELKQFCLKQAAQRVNLWRSLGVFTANDIARMAEVQFVAELTLNMIEGLSDYSSARIDKFYKKYDESFPQMEDVNKRLEKVFAKIAELDPAAIRDTIFSRSPLFFTLFLLIDSMDGKVSTSKLGETLFAVDQSFNADTPVNKRKRSDAEFYLATTASTQRIKSRQIRRNYLSNALLSK